MIKGFSRLNKDEKIKYLVLNNLDTESAQTLYELTHSNKEIATLIEGFSENVLSNFIFPYSIAPNFLIDNKEYAVPMVTEESSVVAAASKSATYWFSRGGFKTQIIGTVKKGQVHFIYDGDAEILRNKFSGWKKEFYEKVERVNTRMKERGGGILDIEFVDCSKKLDNYFQVDVGFNTCNAMGANYMNSCLELIGDRLEELVKAEPDLVFEKFDVVMAILSNYSPENAVRVYVECPVTQLEDSKITMHPTQFANKFREAVEIANVDVSRAVTHNKGIYNGIDAVAIATGNDWRAIEANGHAYASRLGQYQSLSNCTTDNGIFRFEAIIPMQVGTVGGIAGLHPLAKLSMKILNNPTAEELMKIIAATGLAQNFGAVKSLVTTGIQKGHMKMHLSNILISFYASAEEIKQAREYFEDKTVTHAGVEEFITKLRVDSGNS